MAVDMNLPVLALHFHLAFLARHLLIVQSPLILANLVPILWCFFKRCGSGVVTTDGTSGKGTLQAAL